MQIAMRIGRTVMVAGIVGLMIAGSAHAQSACDAAKVKSTGKLFGCLMNLEASALKSGGVPAPTKLAKCDGKFDAACAKGEARGDCGVTSFPCPKIREMVARAFKFYGQKGCVHAPADLVAWWPFDEAQGTFAADMSQFAYVWPANPLAPYPLGRFATHQGGGPVIGRHDNGFNGYATAAAPASHDPSALTIDAWVDTASFYGTVLRYDDGTGGSYEFLWLGSYLYLTSTCGGGYHEVPMIAAPSAGPWTHLALTIDATSATGYMDGVPVAPDTPVGSYNLDQCQPGGTWHITPGFSGAIDELEVFERVLTGGEIAALATSPAGKCKPPCY